MNSESNISSVAVDTSGAASELTTAAEYQRKAGRRAACLLIVLVIVVAIVLLAVRVDIFRHCCRVAFTRQSTDLTFSLCVCSGSVMIDSLY